MLAAKDGQLYPVVYDVLRAHGHRPGLHLVAEGEGRQRAWVSAAGFGALGHSIEHACRLYVQAGVTLAKDPELRASLRRLAGAGVATH
jgi:hypothetical protein